MNGVDHRGVLYIVEYGFIWITGAVLLVEAAVVDGWGSCSEGEDENWDVFVIDEC